MAKIISPVANNESFGEWVDVTNQLVNAMLQTVTLSLGANADITTGKGFVSGVFGANVLYASSISGGNIASNSVLSFTSNVTFTGSLVTVVANSYLSSNSVILGAANTVTITGSNTVIVGNNISVAANAVFSGRGFTIPSGNTANRPTGFTAGTVRFNTDTVTLEVASNTSVWKTVSAFANTLDASSVSFAPDANISATTVQAAIAETYAEKVSLTGDTMTGSLVINKNGTALPSITNGSTLQLASADGITSRILLDSFGAVPTVVSRRSGGTNASKTALANNDQILVISVSGFDGNSYSVDASTIEHRASQAWTNTAHGSYTVIRGTANGSATLVDSLIVSPSSLTGSGSINANGALTGTSLSVSGNGTFTGTVTASDVATTSDRRFKENIEPLRDAMEIIKKLEPVSYYKLGRKELGLIAQEVEKYIPEAVFKDNSDNHYLSLVYSNIVALLIQSVKELEERVSKLEE